MLKKSKFRLLSILLVMLFFNSTVVFADTEQLSRSSDENITIENAGAITEVPEINIEDNIAPFGINPPATAHNLKTQGRMNFSGVASGSTLYSNYYFIGKPEARIQIKNNHASKDLKVRVYKKNALYPTWERVVYSGWTVNAHILNLDSNGLYYIKFDAPSNFTGYVE